jgi:cyclophilin family peptidyl-prolyl cis-trans isomerase
MVVQCPFCGHGVEPTRDTLGRLVCPLCRNTGRTAPPAPPSAAPWWPATGWGAFPPPPPPHARGSIAALVLGLVVLPVAILAGVAAAAVGPPMDNAVGFSGFGVAVLVGAAAIAAGHSARKAARLQGRGERTGLALAGLSLGYALAIPLAVITAIGVVTVALSGVGPDDRAHLPAGDPIHPRILLRTDVGDMEAELDGDRAPRTVAHFMAYVDTGYYTDVEFYRIVPGFVSQGGAGGSSDGPRPALEHEATGLRNDKYTLAMARAADPDSADSEFYINAADNCFLDPAAISACPDRLVDAHGYVVFGRLVSGFDVADRLNGMEGGVALSITRASRTPGGSLPSPSPGEGCPSMPARPSSQRLDVQADLITPGAFNVCADDDSTMVWVHNNSTVPRSYTFSVTRPGGAPLPAGWSFSFLRPSGTLEPVGTAGSGRGSVPPDWAWTRMSIHLGAGEAGTTSDIELELHAGGATVPFWVRVAQHRGPVVAVGEDVVTCYALRGSDGRIIQQGSFPFQPGRGSAVVGYEQAVIGMAVGETATLVVPAAFAYGEAGNPPDIQPGETLEWQVQVVESASRCP